MLSENLLSTVFIHYRRATVSNLTFASVQADIAKNSHPPIEVILGGQVIGAVAGNMICLFNIVAVSGGVSLFGKGGRILRQTVIPAFVSAVLVAFGGLVYIILL